MHWKLPVDITLLRLRRSVYLPNVDSGFTQSDFYIELKMKILALTLAKIPLNRISEEITFEFVKLVVVEDPRLNTTVVPIPGDVA